MDNDLDRFDDAMHAIYAASMQPLRWSDAVGAISRLCGASAGLLYTWAHSPAQGGFAFPHRIPQAALEVQASQILEDPYVKSGVKLGLNVEGTVVLGDDLVPRAALLVSPFYRELWQPVGIAGLCTSVVFDGTDAHKLPTVLAIYHALDEPCFTSTQTLLLQRVLPHVSRALGVMFHLRDQQLQVASSVGALERLPGGVLLLDGHRAVQFANQAAQRVLKDGRNLIVVGGKSSQDGAGGQLRLVNRLEDFQAALQHAISDALAPWSPQAEPKHFSQALVLPDTDGRPQCVVHVAPLGDGGAFAAFGEHPRAIVFVYDLAKAASVPAATLCELFGLTRAEARAARQVLAGGSAADMAARLDVTVNTFKTQLKAAYAKTHTNRQVDLLKLLLALAAT